MGPCRGKSWLTAADLPAGPVAGRHLSARGVEMKTDDIKLQVLQLWREWPERQQYDELDKAIFAFVGKLTEERPDIYGSGHLGYNDKFDTIRAWIHDYERE